MADLLLDEQSFPATPAAGKDVIFCDSVISNLAVKDDGGLCHTYTLRSAIAAQGAGFASDTYVTNSGILIPSFGFQVGMGFYWRLSASKTAAGVAGPIYTFRLGSGQAVGDTSRLALTGPAQTAAADLGILHLMLTVRSVGAAGVLQGTANWAHNLGGATGFGGTVEGTSAGFDMTTAPGLYLGLSINGGSLAAWTITQVHAELFS